MSSKYVSIIVPTFNDWARLRLCVDALSVQTYPKEFFEVIIVNNNPNDTTPANFFLPANFKLITEAKPGSYAARNAALRIAEGEIIGFTDSDCIPDKDWIRYAVEYFQNNPSCSRIAGKISIFYKSDRPTMAELYNTIYSFPQKMHANKNGTSVTANLFTRRHVFDTVGPFDEKLFSLGDLKWGRLANEAGFGVEYVPNVNVNHPARSLAELVKKEKRVGGGLGIRQRENKSRNYIKLLNEFRPRLAEFKFIITNGDNLSVIEKSKVLWLRHYLLAIRAYERFKVQLGKEPNRE